MTSIKISQKTATLYGSVNFEEYNQTSNLLHLLNTYVLPDLNYNSNIDYYIPFGSNSCFTYGYGWYDKPTDNSNILLIPNFETSNININYLIPSYNEFILPDIYIPYLEPYSNIVIEKIKKIMYSFNYHLMPFIYEPIKPYFNVDINNNPTLYSNDIGEELDNQNQVIYILQNKLLPLWSSLNLRLEGFYTFDIPVSGTIKYSAFIINFMKNILNTYFSLV